MNCYCTLVQLKADLGVSGTSDDTRLLAIINASSRAIDRFCNRFFYAWEGTRYFDGACPLFITDGLTFYLDSGDTVQDNPLAAGATTLTVTASTNFAVDQVIWIENEQLHITAIASATTLTVERGWNNTVDAQHAQNTTIYICSLKTDEDGDIDYDNTLNEKVDYILYQLNDYPKTRIKLSPDSNYGGFGGSIKKGVKITGRWGYGDGISATPYTTSGDSVQDAAGIDASTTTITVTDADNFSPGQTILIESEQCYISAYDTTANTLTVKRAVNGTTAATHAKDKVIYIYDYPSDIIQACLMIAGRLFNTRGKALKSERLGDYSYTIADSEFNSAELGLLKPFRKLKV